MSQYNRTIVQQRIQLAKYEGTISELTRQLKQTTPALEFAGRKDESAQTVTTNFLGYLVKINYDPSVVKRR